MFLSSRWGKPSYEIENLPLSEFNRQKVFWEHCTWGMVDDLVALQHSTYVAVKSGKQGPDIPRVKKLAMYLSATKAFIIESTKTVRSAFVGIASAMKDRK